MFDRWKRKKRQPRQRWQPNGFLRLLYHVWMAVFSAAKIAIGAAATVAMIGVICGVVFAGILGNYLQNDIIPNAELDLNNYDMDQTSYMYYVDKNGDIQMLQKIYTSTDRQWASFDELPKDLINAAVAIEDKRFFEHQGVDWITTTKACANMFLGGGSEFGGSTITQQLIKNITQEKSVTVQRKVLEIFRAQLFERHYDKNVVLEWYMNEIYLGEGSYGVKSAAATYFGKELKDLTTAECASLISITNNPSLFDPYLSPERNRTRQLNVLAEMLDQGLIDQKKHDEAVAQEMVFKNGIDKEEEVVACPNGACGYSGAVSTFPKGDTEGNVCPSCGAAVEIPEHSAYQVYSWFVDTVLEDVAKALAKQQNLEWNSNTEEICRQLIRRGGYHIYTTLDMDVQNQLDKIYTNLDEIPTARSKQQLQSAAVVVDNRTGDIIAMVGGVGEKKDFDAFNRATDARLQTGSSIKPLTAYAPGFELGVISPCTVIRDLPLHYDFGAFPLNDSRSYAKSRTIYRGIISSINTIAVNTVDIMGCGYSYQFAKEKFGLSGMTDHYERYDGFVMSDIDYSPLGMGALTLGVSVRDMACAYATFANHGTYRQGRTFTKVYDSAGNLVLDNTQVNRDILSEKSVNYMNYCLDAAVAGGTGTAADFRGMDICGKTGTSSSNRDRWFCGYTGHYTAAVWCGYDDPEEIYLTGNHTNPAARLWKKFMEPIHEGLESVPLFHSDGMRWVSVCLDSGKIATEACRSDVRVSGDNFTRVDTAMAYSEDTPSGYCDKHVMVDYCVSGGGVATEYCALMGGTVEKHSLVRTTQEELDDLLKARNYNLDEHFLMDKYIYLVDGNGRDASFHGINGNANKNVDAPYIVCPVHNKEAFETMPTEPTEPSEPTDIE